MKNSTAYLLLFLLKFCSLLKLTTVRSLAKFLGLKLVIKNPRTRNTIDKNLLLSLPDLDEKQRYDIIENRSINIAQTFLEMSYIWFKPVSDIVKLVKVTDDSKPHEQLIAKQEGTIILVPHIGNWEVLASYITQFKPFTAMYKPVKNLILDKYVKAARERTGAKLVPTNATGVKNMIKALKNNETVLLLPDQVPSQGGGVFAPLFNHQAYTMTLAHRLASRTKARTLMAMCHQTAQGFEVSLMPMPSDFYDKDAEISATALNSVLEQAILKEPNQNQWEYKRYKVQPDQQPSLYL